MAYVDVEAEDGVLLPARSFQSRDLCLELVLWLVLLGSLLLLRVVRRRGVLVVAR